jgi:hypothetical protein
MNVTFTWTASGGAIDAKGLYTPDKVGQYEITAKSGSITGKTNITVTHGALAKLDVTPKTATITADQTQQFNASGSDAKGNPMQITPSPSWSANGGTISTAGLYAPKKIGTYTITATSGTISGTASITVTPGKVFKLEVDPKTKTITADETQQFNATGYDAKDNPVSVTVTWAASGGSSGGSIGITGLYTPNKVGTYTITATSGTLSATADIEVTPGKLASVQIDPPNATLEEGKKVKFTIKDPKDAKGNDILLTALTITWSVGNASIGSVAQGEFTAAKAGTTTVTASVTDGQATKNPSAEVIVTAKPKPPLGGILGDSSTLLWLFLIIIIVVIAIVVALLVVRRRKKQAPAYPEYQFYPQYGPQPVDFQQYPQQGPPGYPDQSGYPPQQQYPQQYGQGGEQEPQWTKNY